MFWVLGRYQTCGVQVPSRLRVAVAVAVAFAARCSASMECADLCCLCLWWPRRELAAALHAVKKSRRVWSAASPDLTV